MANDRELADEPPAPSITARFILGGRDVGLDEVTRRIGRQPTATSTLQPSRARVLLAQPDGWTHSWGVAVERRAWSTDDVVTLLLDELAPFYDAIGEVAEALGLERRILCRVMCCGARPLYDLSVGNLARVARLGAGFEVYIWGHVPS